MEGDGKRHPQHLVQDEPRPAREPVVAVQHVVDRPVAHRPAGHPFGEVAHRVGEGLGTGPPDEHLRQFDYPVPGDDLDLLSRSAAGEDVYLHPPAGQGRRQLMHVDVHAAGIPPAWLRKRGGVDAQEGDSLDQQTPSTAKSGRGRAPRRSL